MHLLPNDDQVSIRDTAVQMLENAFGAEHAHAIADGRTVDEDGAWRALADMGWFGLAVSEDKGGAGLSTVEETLVFDAAGHALAPVSLLATVLAVHAADLGGDAQLLEELLAGHVRAGLIVHHPGRVVAVAVPDGGVLVELSDSVALHDVKEDACGPAVALIDPATAAVEYDVSEPRLTLSDRDSQAVATRAELVVAAYLSGLSRRVLSTAVAYAKERVAFGHPIGSFQAIKHRLASCAVAAEAADAQVAYASVALAQLTAGHQDDIRAAKVLAMQSALDACGASIQTHGALGVTWEFEAHLFLTRARLFEHVPSGPRVAVERLVRGSRQ
jgi:alkylation response protein AidB-like acyl-CoA dehydrogenase